MSLRLGKAFGIDVYVHWTFLLLLLFIMYSNRDKGLVFSLFAVLVVIGVFGCIVLHELGHALMARHFHIPTRDITLYPIGGVARLERMSERPWEEFCIAVAGPAVNVVIAILLGSGFILSGGTGSDRLQALSELHRDWLDYPWLELGAILLVQMNVVLVLFNMVPAFPMDGGRVFRALLASSLNYVRATEIAAKIGMVFALVFAWVGLFGVPMLSNESSPMLLVVAFFVFIAGQQELAMVRYRAAYRAQHPLEQLEPTGFYVVDQRVAPPEPNFSGFTWDRRAGVWIEWRDGRPVHACQV